MPKRGRGSTAASKASTAKRRKTALAVLAKGLGVSPKSIQPGMVRTGGSYGRYAGRNAEMKFFDTSLSFTFDATGEVPATGQLSLIPQGVTESTRVGRKCVIKSIHIRGIEAAQFGAAATAASNTYLYVVLDKQCNGAAAAVTDVFTSSNLSSAHHNLANSQRFVILKKMIMNMTPGAGVTTAYNNVVKAFDFYRRCNIPLEFSSTTGAITEIRSNNIFLLAGTDAASDDIVTLTGVCRLRFSDGS